MKKPLISVVVPVYGVGFDAKIYYQELVDALSSWAKFEVIFVNDNYEDENWNSIKKLEGITENITSICNGQNKGQHFSTQVGLRKVTGDYIVVCDCDGQDNPFEIRKMFEYLEEGGFNAVFGQRLVRNSNFSSVILSKCFYFILKLITGIEYDYRTTSFGVVTKKTIKCLLEKNAKKIIYGVSIRLITNRVGFIGIEHRGRRCGSSSYSLYSKIKLGYNILKLAWCWNHIRDNDSSEKDSEKALGTKVAVLGASYLQKPLYIKLRELGILSVGLSWDKEEECVQRGVG